MAKRDDADDAENTTIPWIISICAVVDVVFGGDGGVGFGDIFQSCLGFGFGFGLGFGFGFGLGFGVVVQDADATEPVAPIGFKYRKVVRVGPNGAALNEDERVRIASSVLNVDDAETFVGHGIGFTFGSATF